MFNSIFKIVYFIEFLVITIVRKYFTGKQRSNKIAKDKKTGLEIFYLIINGIGMIIPVVISVFEDKSFTFITKSPPASVLLKRAVFVAILVGFSQNIAPLQYFVLESGLSAIITGLLAPFIFVLFRGGLVTPEEEGENASGEML